MYPRDNRNLETWKSLNFSKLVIVLGPWRKLLGLEVMSLIEQNHSIVRLLFRQALYARISCTSNVTCVAMQGNTISENDI